MLYILVILVISRFGFEGWILVLIAPVPKHCLLVTDFLLILYSSELSKIPFLPDSFSAFIIQE